MTTNTATVRSIISVNPDPTDVVAGLALATFIAAAAQRRQHLNGSIVSIQFDVERGIGVLVSDAGQREHLANALGFGRLPGDRETYRTQYGTGTARIGTLEGIDVRIWNVEA